MVTLAPVLAASATTFLATNVDDVVLLTMFFARRVPTSRIITGQYLGFIAILVLSCLGLLLALAIPHHSIRFLGLIPLLLGVKQFLSLIREKEEQVQPSGARQGVLSIALITLSNGADNVGVYVPFFSVNRAHLWLILLCYLILVAIWCAVAKWLGSRSIILKAADRVGHILVPFVFVALGIYILAN